MSNAQQLGGPVASVAVELMARDVTFPFCLFFFITKDPAPLRACGSGIFPVTCTLKILSALPGQQNYGTGGSQEQPRRRTEESSKDSLL